ncbi:hypothetical protein BC628DRAFT_431387 [Trametes gibbosa]|nr:hypothetical protein BC628DRAFT_431387 [Trametes gibbosa]
MRRPPASLTHFVQSLNIVSGGCSSEPLHNAAAGVESRPDGGDSDVAIGWPGDNRAWRAFPHGGQQARPRHGERRGEAWHGTMQTAFAVRRARQVYVDIQTRVRPVHVTRSGKRGDENGRSAEDGRWERETSCRVRRGRPRRNASRCQSCGAWGLTCRVRSARCSGQVTFCMSVGVSSCRTAGEESPQTTGGRHLACR